MNILSCIQSTNHISAEKRFFSIQSNRLYFMVSFKRKLCFRKQDSKKQGFYIQRSGQATILL
jgi:hypothetical protein